MTKSATGEIKTVRCGFKGGFNVDGWKVSKLINDKVYHKMFIE